MQIAAPSPTSIPGRDVTITASEWARDSPAIDGMLDGLAGDPAGDLMRRSSRDLMSLQGIASVKYSASTPGQLLLNFATEGFLRLADNVLRDEVGGVRLVMTAMTPSAPGQDDWWAGGVNQMISSVRSMPGVIDSSGTREHGLKDLTFHAKDAATSARLRALVNEDLAGWRVFWSPWAPKPTPPAG